MGIDLNSLNFLRFCKKNHGDFGRTIMLGRHGIHITEKIATDDFSRNIVLQAMQNNEYFIDETLKRLFGSTSVDSMDFSDYEGASIIHDLNTPIIECFPHFDTVIDAGTTEHIFDVSTAIKNVMDLCAVGGKIIHILPANNYCGHGFWQFSPELFWDLYSPENGFESTEIFLVKIGYPKKWFQLTELAHGGRANFFSKSRVQLLVKTIKSSDRIPFQPPQQRDYSARWAQENDKYKNIKSNTSIEFLREFVNRHPFLREAKNSAFIKRAPLTMRLNTLNPCIRIVNVKEIIN